MSWLSYLQYLAGSLLETPSGSKATRSGRKWGEAEDRLSWEPGYLGRDEQRKVDVEYFRDLYFQEQMQGRAERTPPLMVLGQTL